MNGHTRFDSGPRLWTLVGLRMLIGWHLLYEGLSKILNPYWTSAGFLDGAQGPLAEAFLWLAGDPTRLWVVDWLNKGGLTLLGLALMLGVATRASTLLAMLLLSLYYLAAPPWPGLASSVPAEGAYVIVNKTLIEVAALAVLLAFPTDRIVGLTRLRRPRSQMA